MYPINHGLVQRHLSLFNPSPMLGWQEPEEHFGSHLPSHVHGGSTTLWYP